MGVELPIQLPIIYSHSSQPNLSDSTGYPVLHSFHSCWLLGGGHTAGVRLILSIYCTRDHSCADKQCSSSVHALCCVFSTSAWQLTCLLKIYMTGHALCVTDMGPYIVARWSRDFTCVWKSHSYLIAFVQGRQVTTISVSIHNLVMHWWPQLLCCSSTCTVHSGWVLHSLRPCKITFWFMVLQVP